MLRARTAFNLCVFGAWGKAYGFCENCGEEQSKSALTLVS